MHFSHLFIPLCAQQRTTVTWRVCLLRAQRNRIDCGEASASAAAAAVAASAHYFSPLRAWPRAEGVIGKSGSRLLTRSLSHAIAILMATTFVWVSLVVVVVLAFLAFFLLLLAAVGGHIYQTHSGLCVGSVWAPFFFKWDVGNKAAIC